MATPTQFADLGKPATDVLTQDFIFTKRLMLKTRTFGGLVFTTQGDMFDTYTSVPSSGDGGASRTAGAGAPVVKSAAVATGAVGIAHSTLPSGFSLDNLQMTSEGRLLLDASLAVDPSLTLSVSAEDGRQQGRVPQSHGTVSLLYNNAYATLTTKLDVVNGPTAHATALFRSGRFAFGGGCQVNTQLDDKSRRPELLDKTAGLGYYGDGWQTTALMSTAGKGSSAATLSFMHALSQDVTVAAAVDYSNQVPEPSMSVGTLARLAPDSYIKAKMDSSAVLSLAFFQQMSKAVGLSFAAQVDTKNAAASAAGVGHKFGMCVTLTP